MLRKTDRRWAMLGKKVSAAYLLHQARHTIAKVDDARWRLRLYMVVCMLAVGLGVGAGTIRLS